MASEVERVALVTGASRGIGRASAKALARAGLHVIVHFGAAEAEAASLVMEIGAAGGSAVAVRADLASIEGTRSLVATVDEILGGRPLDVLVANAGITKSASLEDTSPEDFDRLFAVNLRAPFFLFQQLLPKLRDHASVVFVSSLGARRTVGTLAAYASTKGAIETLARQLASAVGHRGIRVNAVAPGAIDTDMSSFIKTESGRAAVLAMQAFKRIGRPEDVADVVAFLASDGARWITGATIPVDGGSLL
jgi:NAD(P)-dependent dehydrogenase (short-subunit alcohol dehydrogenase family)